jgi:hypothetical protein
MLVLVTGIHVGTRRCGFRMTLDLSQIFANIMVVVAALGSIAPSNSLKIHALPLRDVRTENTVIWTIMMIIP